MSRATRNRLVEELTERALAQGFVVVVCARGRSDKFYRLTILPTMWGELNLLREWGRRSAGRRPQHLVEHHAAPGALRASLAEHLRHRLLHGYQAA